MKYDVFISYRRQGGSERAELLKAVFEKNGYVSERIFMDTHTLKGGDFKMRLKAAIEDSSNFVVLITRGCFDNVKESDFFVFEIAEAIRLKKNIVPVFFDGADSFNKDLVPESIKDLSCQNAVSYSHEYADASYQKLCSFLIDDNRADKPVTSGGRHENKKRKAVKVAAFICIAVLVCFIVLALTNNHHEEVSLSEEKLTEKLEESTMMIILGSRSYATGFLISKDGHALTANHILNHNTLTDSTCVYINDSIYGIKDIICENSQQDYTLFQIDTDGTFSSYLPVAEDKPVCGSEVWVSSFDFTMSGFPPMITTGKVESVVTGLIRTDAKIQEGFSGAPMCNSRGEAVGIALSSKDNNDSCVSSFGMDLHLIYSIVNGLE